MKCINCNEETDHIISQGHTQVCKSCETNRIDNDVLAFIHRNLHGYDHEEVINNCIGLFKNPEDIVEAKTSLIKVYGDKIHEIDSKLHTQIIKNRRDSREGGRPKQVANVRDIISILQALDSSQHKSNIIAKDNDKVPLIKDIAMASSTSNLIDKRFEVLESKFEEFEAKFVENEQLKRDYSEMKTRMTELNKQMEDMQKNLIDAHANIAVLENENKRLTNELKSKNVMGAAVVSPTRPSSSSSSSSSSPSSSHNNDVSDESSDTLIESPTTGGTWGESSDAGNNDNLAVETDQHNNQHPFHVQLSARQKHQRNVHVTQTSTFIAAQAAVMGLSPEEAANIANIAAKNLAKSYSRRPENSVLNHPSYSQATSNGLASHQTNRNNDYPALSETNSMHSIWQNQNRNKSKRRLNQYQLGSKQTDIGLAAPKPDWYDKQTLVIAGLDTKFLSNKDVIYEKINELAGKTINIHHMEILSKAYNHWLTIAIELSAADYTLLNDQNFWPGGIRIRPFQGRRSWRQTSLTRHDRLNSVRMSWAQQ